MEFYHRQDFREDVVVLGQWEQWYDPEFLKDFFYDRFRDRTGPRAFFNITHTAPGLITSVTAAPSTHAFTRETEKLPELSHHVLERHIGMNVYFTFDTITPGLSTDIWKYRRTSYVRFRAVIPSTFDLKRAAEP